MFSSLKSKVATLAALSIPVLANAQTASNTFDAAPYAAQIVACTAGALVIGGAVFALTVAIKSTKWARKAL